MKISSEQFEAILWAMLRLEQGMKETEALIENEDENEAMKQFFVETLDKQKKHFQIFKEMIE